MSDRLSDSSQIQAETENVPRNDPGKLARPAKLAKLAIIDLEMWYNRQRRYEMMTQPSGMSILEQCEYRYWRTELLRHLFLLSWRQPLLWPRRLTAWFWHKSQEGWLMSPGINRPYRHWDGNYFKQLRQRPTKNPCH